MSGDTKRIVGESPSASRSITTRRYFVSEYTLTKSPNNFNVNRNNCDGTCETLSRRSSEDQADFIVSRLNAADAMRELLGRSLRLIETFPFPSESDKKLIADMQKCLEQH